MAALRAVADATIARAIEAAVEALAEGTEAFAAERMNRGIRARAGRPERRGRSDACPPSRSFPIPSTARGRARSRRPPGTSICEALLDNDIEIEHACE